MRTLVLVPFLFALQAAAEEPKKEPEAKKLENLKCNLERLPAMWNLSVKSVTAREIEKSFPDGRRLGPPVPVVELRITLEFTKDVAEAKAIHKLFVPSTSLYVVGGGNPNKVERVQFHFFDEDTVLVYKAEPWSYEGEISGKSGDAFRAVFYPRPEEFKKVKKIDARVFEPEK